MKKLFISLILGISLTVVPYCFPPLAQAVSLNSIGIASYYPINAQHIEDGDIIIATSQGYFLSSRPYDPTVIGIVTTNPAISLKTSDNQGYPVVNAGTVLVKVNGSNGSIKKGEFLTTSAIPGTAMKADKSGYVIGAALEAVSFSKSSDVKLVPISLNMHFLQLGSPIQNSLLDVFSLTKIATYEEPIKVFQYVVATVVLVASFVFGFMIFAKVVNTGVEALGRNPLAGKMIQLSILFNVILIIVIIMTGASIAYIVIRL